MTDRLTTARDAIGAAFVAEDVTSPISRSAYAALDIADDYPVMKVRRIFGSWARAMKLCLSYVENGINEAPVLAIPLVDQTVVEAATLAYTITTDSFTDDGTITYSVDKPAWVTFDSGTGAFAGTAPAFVGDDTDIYSVTLSAVDDYNKVVSDTFTITVTEA